MDLPEPTVLRKRKNPAKYLGEQETPQYNDETKAKLMYKQVYFNAVDTIVTCIYTRTEKWLIGLLMQLVVQNTRIH